jgi:hypothetical protein
MHPVLRRSVDARRLQARKKSEESEEAEKSTTIAATPVKAAIKVGELGKASVEVRALTE